jgi:hypothetical protein
MTRILVGTERGVHHFDLGGSPGPIDHRESGVTALARSDSEFWAILEDREMWRTAGGEWIHAATLDRFDGDCIAVTDVAGVLVRVTEKNGAEPLVSFDQVEGRDEWYTPWGGPPDARSISEDREAVFVNVHVGGIVKSTDGGATWTPTIDIHADVHKVWAGWGRVFAACARGLAASEDGGATWTMRSEGLHSKYCRGVAVCGETVLISASNGPRGGRAALYRGSLNGGRLERCRGGHPDWLDGNIDSYWLDAAPDLGVAAFGAQDGRVFVSADEGSSWEQVASELPGVTSVLVIPD